tara:strand:+ start:888 stop:1007 length:120 start_codon:yes stop_codon:yes gene_type:complete
LAHQLVIGAARVAKNGQHVQELRLFAVLIAMKEFLMALQ